MSLKNKRILITAGPTWVPIDKVRVISNIATGETGILLAEKLCNLDAKVTLLLGPVGYCCLSRKIKLLPFKFFGELKEILVKELRSKRYDAVVHSAAVSDYAPAAAFTNKVKSDRKIWNLSLVPTPKIIDLVKKIDRSVFLVGFKFEPAATKDALIKKTRDLMARAGLDLAVANSINKDRYQAHILSENKIYGPWQNKNTMVNKLVNLIGENLCSS
jgi:phosphopantothenoylcysteine decarboxylase/phosphopantothenate--cysteine ligase